MIVCRRLKTTAQLCKIFPLDPELTIETQGLFENFYKAHKLPNDDERDLLQQVGNVDAEVVDAWCKETPRTRRFTSQAADLKLYSCIEILSPSRLSSGQTTGHPRASPVDFSHRRLGPSSTRLIRTLRLFRA